VLPLADPEARPLLARLDEEERGSTWRLVRVDGTPSGRGAAVVDLLRSMRHTRPVGRLLGLVPDAALDAAYGAVARSRGALGRLVPDGPAPRRFP
jgi:hypothetical protein